MMKSRVERDPSRESDMRRLLPRRSRSGTGA
jgi:hypothetical protein